MYRDLQFYYMDVPMYVCLSVYVHIYHTRLRDGHLRDPPRSGLGPVQVVLALAAELRDRLQFRWGPHRGGLRLRNLMNLNRKP